MKTMRRYTEKPQTLMVEYKDLKAKLFGDQSFVFTKETWEWQRYIQLLETRTKTHHLPQSHQDTKKKVLILLPSVKLRDFPARLLARLRRPSGRRSGGVSSWHSFSTGFLGLFYSCFRTEAWQNPLLEQTA